MPVMPLNPPALARVNPAVAGRPFAVDRARNPAKAWLKSNPYFELDRGAAGPLRTGSGAAAPRAKSLVKSIAPFSRPRSVMLKFFHSMSTNPSAPAGDDAFNAIGIEVVGQGAVHPRSDTRPLTHNAVFHGHCGRRGLWVDLPRCVANLSSFPYTRPDQRRSEVSTSIW